MNRGNYFLFMTSKIMDFVFRYLQTSLFTVQKIYYYRTSVYGSQEYDVPTHMIYLPL